jgi:hypothetical protein
VRRSAERRLNRLKADYRVVYMANLAALAGGFVAGFGSLQAGLTSNLGSAAVFLSHWRSLNSLAARAEREAQARHLVSALGSIAPGAPAALVNAG